MKRDGDVLKLKYNNTYNIDNNPILIVFSQCVVREINPISNAISVKFTTVLLLAQSFL